MSLTITQVETETHTETINQPIITRLARIEENYVFGTLVETTMTQHEHDLLMQLFANRVIPKRL